MSDQTIKLLKTIGVTPWQIILATAIIGSWWATVQPLPGQIAKLNDTMGDISTKVEIHSVLLQQIADIRSAVNTTNDKVDGMRRELSTIEGRLAHHPGYSKTP